jgi:hypothetical protein
MTAEKPRRVNISISDSVSKDLAEIVNKWRANDGNRADVIRRALSIMSHVQGNPRTINNPTLSESFETEILREERNSLGNRLVNLRNIPDGNSAKAPRTKTPRPRKVFISYAREDVIIARTVYQQLRRRGHMPWMDQYSLLKGADWQFAIKSAIRTSEFFAAIISRESVQKTGFVQIEVHDAAQEQLKRPEGSIYFIPIKIDDCPLPTFASRFNYLDLRTPKPYRALFDAIESAA